ncbi:hypothetical protein CF70_017940 [Cupriavidus sp. SK-3]|uniref:DUF6148 family protein n=1 Tax=Cupriavidus sp. SK-3 TaxID=1470558 RepID=UPI0004466B47|nr:DUF6148 family protein [Cupriavidus sp. SK-3]KDP84699.1 hypothetical protein CF70_017940 [Cupriavidus sp. SK-3]
MITVEQAQAALAAWYAASLAVAKSQSYEIEGRKLTRADAAEIRQQITFWEGKLAAARNGGRRMRIGYGVAE